MTATIQRKNPDALYRVHDRMKKASQREIAVGFPAGKAQAYPDGTSVVEVAAAHVFGVGVPVRDFMALAKQGIVDKTSPILKAIAEAQASGKNESVVNALMEAAGAEGQAAIQAAIVELRDPPNAPSTIAAKGSDNPLIDTSHMLQSVTYDVRNKK